MLRIVYFDYFQISKRVKLYEKPYTGIDGVVVICGKRTLVYFSCPQFCLEESGLQVIEAVHAELCCVTDRFEDVCEFLEQSKKDTPHQVRVFQTKAGTEHKSSR